MAEHRNIDERIDAIAQSVELLTIDVHELQAAIKVQFELSKHLVETAGRQAESIQRLEAAAIQQNESIRGIEAEARRDRESIRRLEETVKEDHKSIRRLEETVKEDHKSILSLEATVKEDHKSVQLLNAAILKMTQAESRMMDTLERVFKRSDDHESRIHTLETQ